MRLFFALLLFILSSETKRTSGNIRVLDVSLMPYWTPPEVRLCKAKQSKERKRTTTTKRKENNKRKLAFSLFLLCLFALLQPHRAADLIRLFFFSPLLPFSAVTTARNVRAKSTMPASLPCHSCASDMNESRATREAKRTKKVAARKSAFLLIVKTWPGNALVLFVSPSSFFFHIILVLIIWPFLFSSLPSRAQSLHAQKKNANETTLPA